MSVSALLIAIAVAVAATAVYGLRTELVSRARYMAIDLIHERAILLLQYADPSLTISDLNQAVNQEWDIFHRMSHGQMVLSFLKWRFAQFYPELAADLAALQARSRQRSTLE